jgi:hypothetical protein
MLRRLVLLGSCVCVSGLRASTPPVISCYLLNGNLVVVVINRPY